MLWKVIVIMPLDMSMPSMPEVEVEVEVEGSGVAVAKGLSAMVLEAVVYDIGVCLRGPILDTALMCPRAAYIPYILLFGQKKKSRLFSCLSSYKPRPEQDCAPKRAQFACVAELYKSYVRAEKGEGEMRQEMER